MGGDVKTSINKLERAVAFCQKGEFDVAEKICKEIITNDGENSEALHILGNIYYFKGDYDAAIQTIGKAVTILPTNPKYHTDLGFVFKKAGNYDRAIYFYKYAIKVDPSFSTAYINLATLLEELNNYEECVDAYLKALNLEPENIKIYNNLGHVYFKHRNLKKAIDIYKRGLRLDTGGPESASLYANLGVALFPTGRYEEALACIKESLRILPTYASGHSNLLLYMHYLPQYHYDEIFDAHIKWGETQTKDIIPLHTHGNDRNSERTLRIGYVSGDFHDHSVMYFFTPILRNTSTNFHTYIYANQAYGDAVTNQVRARASQWRVIMGAPDEQVVRMIVDDEIDILVDLSGHTANNRLGIFARRPAPVQITYLGYPDTTGLRAMNYRFTDIYSDPKEMPTPASEKLVRLSPGFLCYSPSASAPRVGPLPLCDNGYVTFGSFNNLCKINRAVIELWSEILRNMPTARLVLKSSYFKDDSVRESYIKMFREHGVAETRVGMITYMPSLEQHLDAYNNIDISLDPFPYNGTTTTFESLWMGVPVITLVGHSHASRVGKSILSRIGFRQLIAANTKDYVDRTVYLAEDMELLRNMRTNLRATMQNSSLVDAKGFTAMLEETYRSLWRDYSRGEKV